MIEWNDNLYIGAQAAQRMDEIREDVTRGEFDFPQLYLLTLASNGIDQLDIFPARRLIRQKAAVRRCGRLAGVAIGKAEAMDLLAEIASEVVLKTGGCDLRRHLERRLAEGRS